MIDWKKISALVLFIFVLLEIIAYVIARKKYDYKEMMCSLFVTLGYEFFEAGIALASIPYLNQFWLKYRIFNLETRSIWEFVGVYIVVDFLLYATHALSHSVKWFWASHSVHHSGNHFTFANGRRFSWTAWISGAWLFFIPLIVLGFQPAILLAMFWINLSYQTFLHTEFAMKLGFLDYIFNTPTNHRVHHMNHSGSYYKNLGGTLIIFDRIFGTFRPFDSSMDRTYGLNPQSNSYNPVKVAFYEWILLWKNRPKTGFLDSIKYILSRPNENIKQPNK